MAACRSDSFARTRLQFPARRLNNPVVEAGIHASRRTLSMKQVIIIGDSIAMAYGPLVQDSLAGWAEVWQPKENAGTSANVLAHLTQWALDRRADLIHQLRPARSRHRRGRRAPSGA
jgi:hypothetical protein